MTYRLEVGCSIQLSYAGKTEMVGLEPTRRFRDDGLANRYLNHSTSITNKLSIHV